MSDKINDGGPAFPSDSACHSWQCRKPSAGMTLRDYFAEGAMRSIIGAMLLDSSKTKYNLDLPDHFECVALDAYRMADAMLKVREGSK